ncbi:biotin-dependent carboxyltransferase family protein, partial [Pseudomonas carnis]|uniref:5-oxoprolinase subunit C family protein n=1 Tax=Pseudomonas carnis TaxID=2487355 RepID=UPI001F25CF0B
MIKVLKPGLATSVQDLGREGYYHLGIPPSGALDQYALSAANHLVGNPVGAAGLECTLIGPELEFQQDALVALSGALMSPRLDDEVVHQDTAFAVRAGQVLRFEFPKAGARTYLAVAGGIDVPLVLGSRSTYTLGALGGFNGRRLPGGAQFPTGNARGNGGGGDSLPEAVRGWGGGGVALSVG